MVHFRDYDDEFLIGYFTDEDEDLLVAIGSSAGIALENAQLFKTQQKMLEEQKVVFKR